MSTDTPTTTFVALLFPDITQLDLTGPVQVFSRLPGARIELAWHTLDPVPSDAGFSIMPTTTFDDAPQADIVMVPGGQGAFELLDDEVALDFVRRQAADARYVTSVCTGAFVLAAAGLLTGRRATTHWASHPMLDILGVQPVHERVVRDGNVFTGGGVTSGIDFALTVAAELAGPAEAAKIQLALEYDPQPPMRAGSPSGADTDPAVVEAIRADAWRRREPVVRRAAARLGPKSVD
ncbi:DJ-1/PfpI family protein [Mycolicibacterium tokaiense]|uniref:ThiJ/PfpI n=1 Tax=Mycolicibacterium tokaiense TaxID=39695 RepID=A0A378TE25_9MYCO|nr:DJ-1/PfpI family protein [Mycolicibacterium tokaiense]BBY87390.1 glutamine amidotransferase [Mycolicibacterium tokaiense]STZ58103.1 ThiJ/PfpI [Mycolicibacterium tokaiense]